MALIGTPCGSCPPGPASDIEHRRCEPLLGCAAFRPQSGVQGWPCPVECSLAGGVSVIAFPPDIAVFGQGDIGEDGVCAIVSMALGLDW